MDSNDLKKQVDAAATAVLVVPRDDLAVLAVTGNDRLTWLNGLVTCDLAKAKPGDCVYGLAVGKNGRVLSDLIVAVEDTRVLVVSPRAVVESLRTSLDHYLIMEDAEMAPAGDAFAVFTAHGPAAASVFEAARAAGAFAGVIDLTGSGGALILAPAERKDDVARALGSAAANVGGTMGDDAGLEAHRLERAVPRFGADFDQTTYPQEAGLEKNAVSFQKGCYLGQEVVCMLEMRGHVKRRLVSLVLEGAAPARGAVVSDANGATVGAVTSAIVSPSLGGAIALAMVKRASTEPGTVLAVNGAPARVVERPV